MSIASIVRLCQCRLVSKALARVRSLNRRFDIQRANDPQDYRGSRIVHSATRMFCPLCQAEYRDGFIECSDCHLHLVPSREQAASLAVRLWKGDRRHTLSQVISAMNQQGICYHLNEFANVGPRLTILGIPVTPRKSTFEYEVWVLRSDFGRAQEVIGRLSDTDQDR